MKKYKITSLISKRIYKIIDFFFKDKDRNYQIKKNIRKFARFTIKNIFHFFRIRFLYYFCFKKNLVDLLPKTTRLNNHTKLYDVYSVLEFLIEKKKIKKILEIGIGGHSHEYVGGESLRVFNFLFNNAQIYAIDILPKNFLDSKSIKTIICDEGDFKKKKEISDQIGDLDLIIDDGSHIPKNQINTFEIFFEKLNEGGVYIIEDIGTSYINAIGGDPKLSSEKNVISFFSQYIHNTQSIMLINEEKQKISKYKNINQIFFFEDNIMIQKKIKNEKVFSDEDAYSSREERNKKYSINKLSSGLHIYEK